MEIIKRLEVHRGSQSHKKHVRYPEELRQAAGRYYRQELASGRRRHDVAHELGVHANTLDCWRPSDRDKTDALPATFRAVVVSGDKKRAATATVVVHGPCGLRIEGLGVAQLAELVRALR